MKKVYLVQHRREVEDDAEEVKTIGIYSSEGNAKLAIARLIKQPGFRDYPSDFNIDDYELDQDEWTDGFITEAENLASIKDTAAENE